MPGSSPGTPRPPDASGDANIGRTLGERYRVLRRIGEGGMGTVYLCEHVLLHRRVAVKLLKGELARDPELVERFRNEAVAASQIGSEHVVDVIDLGRTEEGAFFYAMEALDGRSLGAILRDDGPLDVGRALGLVAQVCRALSAAHARGVVHRDLKPENVFVVVADDGAERAKVLDFGISRIEPLGTGERLTRAGAIIGTPEYMAPEQASGSGVDGRADVYALGVLLYEVLTGRLPFEADTPLATLVAHQSQLPDPPSARRATVPLEVDAVVLRALAKRPEDRWPSMDAFGAELIRLRARLGEATPPATRRPSVRGGTVALPATPVTPTRTRRRLAIAASAAFVVAVAAGLLLTRPAPAPAPAIPTPTATSSPSPSPSPSPSAQPTPTPTSNPDSRSSSTAPRPAKPKPSPKPTPQPAADPWTTTASDLKPDPFE